MQFRPSLRLRQLRSRYAIRAGRNLPDKEFRYLRMVYSYHRRLLGLKFSASLPKELTGPLNLSSTGQASVRIHRLTTSHGPVFLVNSRFSLVSGGPTQLRQ